jgi:hypothetical protein
MTQLYRRSYRYESRFDIRLEIVAYAHTAADLHVRPVSKTALVSRSWTLRAFLEIHDAKFLAMLRYNAASESTSTPVGGDCPIGKQVFESPRGILDVTILIAVAKNFHKLFIFA